MRISLKAMWNYKCPRCRQGDIFTKPFDFSKPLRMPKVCAHCGQAMEPETGFYFGAMFLSYIFSGWYILIPTLIFIFVLEWSIAASMTVAILLTALSYMRILRGARSLWLHMNVKYDPNHIQHFEPAESQLN